MAASTTLITNMTSVLTAGPTSATTAKALDKGGPIMDYAGNVSLVLEKLKEASVLLAKVVTDTDSSDPNLTTLQNVALSLV